MDVNNVQEIKYPDSKKILYWGIAVFLLAVLFIGFAPKLITENSLIPLDLTKANEIGDTLGGILGPIVGLIAVALTFLAFWAQYDANIEQRKQFNLSIYNEKTARISNEKRILEEQEIQNKEFKARQEQFAESQKQQQDLSILQDQRARINLFESRFHSMLAIHRENANNIEVNKISGRKVFLHMLDELKLLYNLFIAINQEDESSSLSDEAIYNIAYLSFFFGIGTKSTPMVKDLAGERFTFFVEKAHLRVLKQIKENEKDKTVKFKINGQDLEWKKHYLLGTGHLRRLGHYIRHLFQTVKFVDDQNKSLIKQDSKYNYVANLRSQLTAHEQVLLFYNSISVMGEPWLAPLDGNKTENLIERYCMIKSIPLNAVDFYRGPLHFFQIVNTQNRPMFEWAEIKVRMKSV